MDLTKKLTEELLETIKDSKNFLKEELPQVAQEILRFDFIYNICFFIFYLINIVIIVSLIYYGYEYLTDFFPLKECHEYSKSCNSEIYTGRMVYFILTGIIGIAFSYDLFKSMIVKLSNCIQIKTAPKYYLVEKIKNL